MPEPTHPCPKLGCGRRVPFSRLACQRHWYELPLALRNEIGKAWRRGDLDRHLTLRAQASAILNRDATTHA